MQSLKQDRMVRLEVHKEVWCVKCKSQGHDKDHCPIFTNYLTGGGSMPLRPKAQARPSAMPDLWCAIFQIVGKHATNNCHLLQKYTQNSKQLIQTLPRTDPGSGQLKRIPKSLGYFSTDRFRHGGRRCDDTAASCSRVEEP